MKQVEVSIEKVKQIFNVSNEKYFTFYFNDNKWIKSKIFSIDEKGNYFLIKRENEEKPRTIVYFDDIKRAYVHTFDLSKSLNKFVKVVYWDLFKNDFSTIEGVISHFNREYDSIIVTPKDSGASLSVLSYFIQSIEEMKIMNQFDRLKPNDKCKIKLNDFTEVDASFIEMSTTTDKYGYSKKIVKLLIASDKIILVDTETPEIKDGDIHTVINYFPNSKDIHEKFEVKYKDGIQIYDGSYKSFFKNGKINCQVNYINGNKHGEEFYYYDNENIKCFSTYEDGILDGPCSYYHEDGSADCIYPYSNGKLEGTFYKYYKNGDLSQSSNYKNNLLHGFVTYYNERIAIKKQYYENGIEIRSPFDLLLTKFMNISLLKNFVTKETYSTLEKMVKITNDKSDFQAIHKLIHEDLTKKFQLDGLKSEIFSTLSQFIIITIEYCKLIDDSEKEEDMKSFLQKLSTKFNNSTNKGKMEDYIQKTIKVKYNDKIRTVIIQNVYTKNNKKYVSVTELFKGQLFEKTFFEDKIQILN